MNKILTFSVLIMLALTSVSLLATKENSNSLPSDTSSGKAAIGGAFTLTDKEGETRHSDEFLGKPTLVFFGFTYCPDICPLTLGTITSALETLGSDADNITPIFISVDPKRDTAERLSEYMQAFDPRIVALTGSKDQIQQAADAYKAYYSEEPKEGEMQHGADYMVNHSSLLYLMDEKGEYITHFPHTIDPEELADTLKEHLKS